jgi:periplasmic copper chaperone A
MKTPLMKHAFVAAATTATVVLFAGGVASAHIDPDPIAIQAGTSATVAFNVEHGCDGSPTTSMKFEIPDGVTDAAGVAKDGWTATLTGNTLEFAGGPLAPEEEDHFDITFTAPATAGNISFPVIQTCEQGEIAWIEPVVEGAEEPELPAPTIKITEGAPTAEDLTPAPEEEDEATDETVAATSDTAAISTSVAADSDDDSSNTTPNVLVAVIVVVALVGGGIALYRRNARPKNPTPSA